MLQVAELLHSLVGLDCRATATELRHRVGVHIGEAHLEGAGVGYRDVCYAAGPERSCRLRHQPLQTVFHVLSADRTTVDWGQVLELDAGAELEDVGQIVGVFQGLSMVEGEDRRALELLELM